MAKKAAKKSSAASSRRRDPGVVEEVRQLVQLMVDHDLGEVDVSDGGRHIHLKRGAAAAPQVQMVPMPAAQPAGGVAPTAAGGGHGRESGESAEAPVEELLEVKSPMVGTFYAASSPEGDPFVSVGSAIDAETVVCIVEAMKVMNEVKAECAGTVVEVCARNAQPVEYGQTLFRVKPA